MNIDQSCSSKKYTFRVGQQYLLTGFAGADIALRRKLASLGFVPGTFLEISNVAPLGCPVEFKARGYQISVRCEEVDSLVLEAVAH